MFKNYFLSALIFSLFQITVKAQAPVISTINGQPNVCWDQASSGLATYSATASGNPTNFNWTVTPSYPVTVSSGNSLGIIFPDADGTYTIYCQAVNASGTSNTASFVVTVYELPNVTFSGNTFMCQGSTTFLVGSPTVSSGNSTLFYNWTPNYGVFPTQGPYVAFNPSVTTTYTATVFNGPCASYFPVTIEVADFSFSGNTLICENQSTSLMVNHNFSGSSTLFYSWLPAYGLDNTTFPGVTANPTVTTDYTVTLSNNFCAVTRTISVIVDPCVGIKDLNGNVNTLYVYPNPNNGKFTLKSSESGTGSLINELGQTVRQLKFIKDEATAIEGLDGGVYFILTPHSRTKIVVIR